jgi:hypothetical protein
LHWDNRFWLIAIPAALPIGAGVATGQGAGFFFPALAGLSMLYAIREATVPLWIVSVLSVSYGALVIFGSGPIPLAASLILLVGTVFWTPSRRTA